MNRDDQNITVPRIRPANFASQTPPNAPPPFQSACIPDPTHGNRRERRAAPKPYPPEPLEDPTKARANLPTPIGDEERGGRTGRAGGREGLRTGMTPSNWVACTILPRRSWSLAMGDRHDLHEARPDLAYSAFQAFGGAAIPPRRSCSPPPSAPS
jgi:hypothetical protein